MSSHWYGVGVGIVLGLGGLSAVALADGSPPREPDGAVRSTPAASAPQAQAPQADETRAPQVEVRDLRAEREQRPAATEIPAYYNGLWQRNLRTDAQIYSPYGGYYTYGWADSPDWWEDVYRAMRRAEHVEEQRAFDRRDMAERKERLLNQHERALRNGLRQLKEGQPERATIALTLAAKLNQGDPACRIYLAQSRVAQGQYVEAAMALRRALELQPKLIYVDLHLADQYPSEADLDRYVSRLAKWVSENKTQPEVYFLLGFLEFQRGDFDAAHAAFERFRQVRPDDALTLEYLSITKPSEN